MDSEGSAGDMSAEESCSTSYCSHLWVDTASCTGILWLMLDDMKGNGCRTPLDTDVWYHIASFLRFPGPLQTLYIFGGRQRSLNGEEEHLDTVQAYDWWNRCWLSLPKMAARRVGAAAAVLGQSVIVAGGYNSRSTEPLDSVESYDTFKRIWRMLPPMPTRRYGLALAAVAKRVFAIGGDNGHNVCAANESYAVGAASWSKAAPLPKPLAGGKAEAHSAHIYYVGGCDQHEGISSAIHVYSHEADCWNIALSPTYNERLELRIGRTSFAMALIDGLAYSPRAAAHLLITGGVSATDFFLSDAELLQIGGSASSVAPAVLGGEDDADGNVTVARAVPPMPRARSGCRSCVLWPSPSSPFLPWTANHQCPAQPQLAGDNAGADELHKSSFEQCSKKPRLANGAIRSQTASPFVVILGGEAPGHHGMEACEEPVTLDIARRSWHVGAGCATAAILPHEDASLESGVQPQVSHGCRQGKDSYGEFFDAVSGLRTSRVAFAIAVAPGLPLATRHGG